MAYNNLHDDFERCFKNVGLFLHARCPECMNSVCQQGNLAPGKNLFAGLQNQQKKLFFGVFCNCLSIISNRFLLNVTCAYYLKTMRLTLWRCPCEKLWALSDTLAALRPRRFAQPCPEHHKSVLSQVGPLVSPCHSIK